MTEIASGEDLESAGPRWKGGVEWSDGWGREVRHWWRLHPKEPILIHRASGEQVAYIGPMTEPNWRLFEYRHQDIVYPLAVEMKRVWWPNPFPDRYAGPPYNAGPQPELSLRVWRVDHMISAELWRREGTSRFDLATSDHPPPYWLWRRVDQAISDAALLWPKKYPSDVAAATEVAINGGWLNGAWRTQFFRRMRRYEDYDPNWRRGTGLSSIAGWPMPVSIDELGLPLQDHYLDDTGAVPPRWERISDSGMDLHGRRTHRCTLMRNTLDSSLIAATPCDLQRPRAPQAALVILRDGIAWALPVVSEGQPSRTGLNERSGFALANCSSWNVQVNGPCTISETSFGSAQATVPWLGKPVLALDAIGTDHRPYYNADAINHPLSSYRSWRFLYDCLLDSLLFSPGFEDEDFGQDRIQGDVGQVRILGGFVGGIQQLTTEVRAKLELSSDGENTTWTRFFS